MIKNSPTSSQPDSEIIDSLSHPLAVWLRGLLDGGQNGLPRSILIDDEENILQALRAGLKVERVFHTGDNPVSALLRRALPAEATIHEVATRTSKKLFATSKLSRIFAVAQAPRAAGLRDLATLQQDIVVLENVALGVGGVVLLDSDTEVYDRRLIRASRGQVFSLPVVKATQEELLAFCRQHGWKLLVTDPQASYLVHDIASLQGRLAIVFGNEKKGCSGALLKAASLQIKIPTDPLVESLNVSAAAAITLFHRSKSNLCPLAP
jgi:TrmH family RNA methyltransferase